MLNPLPLNRAKSVNLNSEWQLVMTSACLTQEIYCLTIFLYHNLKVVKVVIILHQTIMQAQQIQQRMGESLLMEPLHPQTLPITATPLITQRDLKVAAAGQLPSTGPASTRPGCQTVHACHFPLYKRPYSLKTPTGPRSTLPDPATNRSDALTAPPEEILSDVFRNADWKFDPS